MRKQGLFILLLLMSLCSMMRAQTSFTYGGLNYTVLSEADGTAIVGKNAPSREIFLQKEWFSQILCSNLPCHWWFLLVLICSTKVGEKNLTWQNPELLGFAFCANSRHAPSPTAKWSKSVAEMIQFRLLLFCGLYLSLPANITHIIH